MGILHQTKYIFLDGIIKCNFLLSNFTSHGLWLKLLAFQFKTHRELIILGNNNIMSMSFFYEKKESKGESQIVDYDIFYIIFKGNFFFFFLTCPHKRGGGDSNK
jgi:hypothetical protein